MDDAEMPSKAPETEPPACSASSPTEKMADPGNTTLAAEVDTSSNHETLAVSIVNAHQQREQRLKTQKLRALKSVAKYNSSINRERISERKNYFDLQTNVSVHLYFPLYAF